MFLRSVKAANGHHEYLRLVESFRDGDKVKQRIVAHLGRKDLLAPHLDALIRLLQDESAAPRWVSLMTSPLRVPPRGDPSSLLGICSTSSRWARSWTPAGHRSAMASRCRRGSFHGWPIASPGQGASTPWPSGWKISMYAIRKAAAGRRPGNNRAA